MSHFSRISWSLWASRVRTMPARNRERIFYRKQFTGNTNSLMIVTHRVNFAWFSTLFHAGSNIIEYQNGDPSILRTASRTIPSCGPAWSFPMSILCSLCRRKWSAPRLKQLWRNWRRNIAPWSNGQCGEKPGTKDKKVLCHQKSTRSNTISIKRTWWLD